MLLKFLLHRSNIPEHDKKNRRINFFLRLWVKTKIVLGISAVFSNFATYKVF